MVTVLRSLDLAFNDLTGSIPAELGNLVQLESLHLRENGLTGSIPVELGSLVNLTWLSLGSNDLTGSIPAELGNLARLMHLSFQFNSLSGPIPVELGNLTSLEELFLDLNRLTGPLPAELGGLASLEELFLGGNALSGRIPEELGSLANLKGLSLHGNDLTGSVPAELGSLANLERLDLSYNWGLSGPLPAGLEQSRLEELWFFVTRTCAPAAWRRWLATVDLLGPLCEAAGDVTIDVAVVHTPAAREAAGGAAAVAAAIDLMIAETNEAYAASGVRQRLALVARSEVEYTEGTDLDVDIARLRNPSDGHLDEVHAMRDRTGADLVHLIVAGSGGICGIAGLTGVVGVTRLDCGGIAFAHELGHNMGLRHDRHEVQVNEGGASSHPAYGYVNQRAFEADAGPSSRWRTTMAYRSQCVAADFGCTWLLRFSNASQRHEGDRLGVPFGEGGSGLTGPADAAAVLASTGPAVALWRDRPAGVNGPPAAVGRLADRTLQLESSLQVDASSAFADPDRDPLSYRTSSTAPDVVGVRAAGARVTLSAVALGSAIVRVAATDPGGLSAVQSFTVTVTRTASFTDDPIQPGVTPIRAVHLVELRSRIDALRRQAGLAPVGWTDPVLTAGVTPVRLAHLVELRVALAEAHAAAGRPAPVWTDTRPVAGATPIRAVHLMELRAAVRALE